MSTLKIFKHQDQFSPSINCITRRNSFPQSKKDVIIKNLGEINNSPVSLKRSNAISNLYLFDENVFLSYSTTIEYTNTEINDINSEHYVYCGIASTLQINNLGMSVDNDGNLVLIKGKRYNLFNGLKTKYTSGYKYKTANLMNSKYNIKFNGLHINDNRQLIGDEKDTVKSYIINISARKIKDDNNQVFDISFSEYDQDDKDDRLSFKTGDNDVTSYFLADNRLHLKSTQRGGKLKDYSVLLCEMSIPLKPTCKIKSIKRSMSFLQVETQTGKKTRIYYINPEHISNKKLSVKKVSHKPQQSFPSRLGNDPHEIYHAGLPFTSDRKANFSSKNIPFVSSVVDNFRVHVKLAKERAAENKNKDAILHCAKAIDPGFTGVCSALSGLAKSTQQKIYTNLKNNKDLYDYNISMTKSRGTSLSNLVSDSLGTHSKLNNISEELLSLTKKINPNESIQLNSTNRIAVFFGIASGGIPFVSGWFTCILAELCDNYNLNIFKTETGNIRLSFHHRYKTSGTALVGTGQGLERHCVKLGVLDFLSVMPAEANLIMSINCMSGNNFSFELSEDNYEKFVTQLANTEKNTDLEKLIINEAEAIKIKDKELLILIEAKSELRAQLGFMTNRDVYMVMPRTAACTRLAIDLLKIKSRSELKGIKDIHFSPEPGNFEITLLSTEANVFYEHKVMPIVLNQAENNRVWCYPYPFLEESRTHFKSQLSSGFILAEKSKSQSKSYDNYFSTTDNIRNVENTLIYLTVNGKHGFKHGLKLKKVAMQHKEVKLAFETISDLKKTFTNQQRASQNKFCKIIVISHYERIDDPSPQLPDNIPVIAYETKSYRLIRLEFRRKSSLSHVKATIPTPVLSFSSTNDITYDQYLGKIEFLYTKSNDIAPYSAERRLLMLY